ncbi:hypothetical protein GCM10009811_04060 [Nostocoides veronense]|uniref:Uncharacterized protein n=1 Tax=Nostocoides veronense TaxID=330836 RepID=A0ABP4XJS9_9MICO
MDLPDAPFGRPVACCPDPWFRLGSAVELAPAVAAVLAELPEPQPARVNAKSVAATPVRRMGREDQVIGRFFQSLRRA